MDYIDKFTEHLMDNNLSSSSIDNYRRDLQNFNKYLIGEYNIDFLGVKKSHILTYFIALQKNDYKQSTINRYVSSLKKFYNFLEHEKILKYNPAIYLTTNKVMHKPIEVLTREEINNIFSLVYAQNDSFCKLRDLALLELIYSTGIRLNELIDLKKKDILFTSELITIDGDNPRAVPLSPSTKLAMKKYFERYLCDFDDMDCVFLGNKHNTITRQGVWNIFKRYSALYEKTYDKIIDFTPKSLSSAFVAHIMQNGADGVSMQKILGRKNPVSLKNYSNALGDNILKMYRNTNPRSKGECEYD